MIENFIDITRQPIPMLPLDRRTGITEVEVGYDEEGDARGPALPEVLDQHRL